MLDFDNDNWIDLFVANDTQPNQLFRNRADGTFEDIGVVAGVAFSDSGVARAGMGVDATDYDASGRPGLLVGNFSTEMVGLYHNAGNGLFIDEASRSVIGRATLPSLTFGCFFFDVDLNGWPDIFAVNGHVADDVERVRSGVTYAQQSQLFLNVGTGQFEEIVLDENDALQTPVVGRGGAYADADNDGDLDIAITVNGGTARLLENSSLFDRNVLRVRTLGVMSNRDGIGARIEIHADGRTRWNRVKTGSSYASQSELPVTFGLGTSTSVSTLRVDWPSGHVDTATNIDGNQTITVKEGVGIVDVTPIAWSPPK